MKTSNKSLQEAVFHHGVELWDGKSYPHLTLQIVDRLNSLMDFAEPGELREYLLEIYHMYIIHEHDSLPYNFKELANNMQMLLDFLKLAQKELIDKRSLSDNPK